MNKNEFIEEIAKYVKKYAPEFGICVYSPIVAQACLESGYGTSYKGQRNNFFGLKYRPNRVSCFNGFFYDDSKEQKEDGTIVSINTTWYMFETLEMGVLGYFQFLNIEKYKNLKGITNPGEYLETLKKDGYATLIDYVENVMRVIKENNLTRFDKKGDEVMSFKVHIDPGHQTNHYNQSPTNKNYYESVMVWKLANYLKTELENKGITVTMSRHSINENPKLYDRGYGAKGCNLFLSLHSNACETKESVDYPVVYRGYDKTEADSFGLKMAQLIQELIGTNQKGRTATRTGKNGEYYGVLRGARAAGLTYYYIIEHSFHTNAKATNWLFDDNNLRTLAKKEADLIASFFNVKVSEPEPNAPISTPTQKELYRVRKAWSNAASQIGAYSNLENAKLACKNGYSVFDSKGNVVYTKSKSYIVQITASTLNVRVGAGTNYKVVTTVRKNQKYTIVEERNGWGRLKSGAGWISLKYTKKV